MGKHIHLLQTGGELWVAFVLKLFISAFSKHVAQFKYQVTRNNKNYWFLSSDWIISVHSQLPTPHDFGHRGGWEG